MRIFSLSFVNALPLDTIPTSGWFTLSFFLAACNIFIRSEVAYYEQLQKEFSFSLVLKVWFPLGDSFEIVFPSYLSIWQHSFFGGGRHCVPQKKKEGLDHVNFGLDAEKTKLFCLTVKDFKIAPERAT